MTFPSHVVDDFIPGKLHGMKNIHWNIYISTFWRNITISLEELVHVNQSINQSINSINFFQLVAQFLLRRIFFFFFVPHTRHNDKILIIKHVFIAIWSISSLGPFCWRVLSDCAITWVPLHSDRPTWEIIWKKKIYIWFSHFTWTQTHRW